MQMKPNPDNRADNVQNIQSNINHTIQNIRETEDRIADSDDPQEKEQLSDKNARREQALDGLRHEIRDEAAHRQGSRKQP
jgi:small acid-soluble spore protein (thioredoxin-like protein)